MKKNDKLKELMDKLNEIDDQDGFMEMFSGPPIEEILNNLREIKFVISYRVMSYHIDREGNVKTDEETVSKILYFISILEEIEEFLSGDWQKGKPSISEND
jgi:hypothetical protein